MAKTTITKIERVRKMLQSPKGATLQAICKVTGWQAHSARAALSGLRKAGYTIAREAAGEDKSGGTLYRIIAAPEVAE
jgi:hypothetical protein